MQTMIEPLTYYLCKFAIVADLVWLFAVLCCDHTMGFCCLPRKRVKNRGNGLGIRGEKKLWVSQSILETMNCLWTEPNTKKKKKLNERVWVLVLIIRWIEWLFKNRFCKLWRILDTHHSRHEKIMELGSKGY